MGLLLANKLKYVLKINNDTYEGAGQMALVYSCKIFRREVKLQKLPDGSEILMLVSYANF